jgi:ribosome-binding ATPase
MGFTAGIIGLPNAGKTTIYNALTAAGAEASAYPFCTVEPNIAVASYIDKRLTMLVSLVKPPQWTAATLQFTDVAGLVKGASRGEGLGNQFLGIIRTTDILIHVVRCFENQRVSHMYGELNPANDIDTIMTELILADLESLEKRAIKASKALRGGEKKAAETLKLIERVKMALDAGQPARKVPRFTPDEQLEFDELDLLTGKNIVCVANVDEKDLNGSGDLARKVEAKAIEDEEDFIVLCGELESGFAQLNLDEQKDFRTEYGLTESGLERLVASVVKRLGLIVFYKITGREVRSWLIPSDTAAPEAAGRIHSDMQRGFIKAEILPFDMLVEIGSWEKAREKGLIRQEGKNYLVKDGDVVFFRFNV